MYLVILKGMPYDLLNHVHNVGSKTTALEGPLSDTPNLAPYEVKDAEWSCIRCHLVEQVNLQCFPYLHPCNQWSS